MVMREMGFSCIAVWVCWYDYEPSRRQKEHEIRQQTDRRVSNEINGKKNSNDPIPDVDSYRNDERSKSYAKYFDERLGLLVGKDVSNHWKKRCHNGSKISWQGTHYKLFTMGLCWFWLLL